MIHEPPPRFSFPLGARQSPPDSRDYPARMHLRNVAVAGTLPSADRLDWMPPVLTQTLGSCVTMTQATVSAIHEHAEAGGSIRLTGEPWYRELWAEQNPGQSFTDTGLVPRLALDSWRAKGPPIGVGQREHYGIETYFRVASFDEIRRVITELDQPVLLVSRISLAWPDTTPVGQLVPFDTYGPNTPDPWVGLHEWTVWGYDMRATLGMLIRSSWGELVGVKGSVYMTPRDFEASFVEAWYATSKGVN
jgi:hypothetical protein